LHLASFSCIAAGSALALLTPLVLKWLIDHVIPQRHVALLFLAAGLIFLGYQGKVALASLGNYLTLSAAQRMGLRLRVCLLRHLDRLSSDYYENRPTGSVMYPLKEPIEEIAYFGSDLLPAILRMLLTTTFTLTVMFLLSPVLTLAVVPLVPAFLVIRQYFKRRLAADADAVQDGRLRWSTFLEEHISSVIPIQLLGQERRQERRAFRYLARAVKSQQNLFTTSAWFTVWSSLTVVLAVCAVIGYGGSSVLAGSMSVGSLVAFYGFVTQLFEPLSGAADLYARAQKTFASVRQVQAVLALQPSVTNAPGAVLLEQKPHIEFTALEFGYQRRRETLYIPTLGILPGEHLAIAGENGAGKSTLAKLIARLYDPVRGSILLGGEDLRKLQLESLRKQVCYIPQNPVMFDGTLASNLRFVEPAATHQELQAALQSVGLTSWVAILPAGLEQRIGPGACQLSGGQRQRLAIARALLQRPEVLILDEATSCVDTSAEEFILHNLRRQLSESTVIVVSHRSSTLLSFGRVLILARGRIVYDGPPHLPIIANGPDFSAAVVHQFGS
jgi:ABC-type bacteriocin/lantibiotic exporter with double-glycine peptidase domain